MEILRTSLETAVSAVDHLISLVSEPDETRVMIEDLLECHTRQPQNAELSLSSTLIPATQDETAMMTDEFAFGTDNSALTTVDEQPDFEFESLVSHLPPNVVEQPAPTYERFVMELSDFTTTFVQKLLEFMRQEIRQ